MLGSKRTNAVAASVLLHAILFLLLMVPAIFNLLAALFGNDLIPVPEDDPIVFELTQPELSRKPQEVIETPEDAKVVEEQERADFLSDKNAVAQNQESPDDLETGAAFARGDFDAPELPTPQGPRGEQGQVSPPQKEASEAKAESQEQADNPDYYVYNTPSDFRPEYLVKPKTTEQEGVPESSQRARYDNQATKAPEMGALSFNTYDWDFAPYMIALKRKIEPNIFPPAAFFRLGLINGESFIRFKIYPNGEMRDLKVVSYEGHKTLMETSYRAVEISAPFLHLPYDFPEEYLEVTARFTYINERSITKRRKSR